jgi:hypothetical protein
MFQVGATVKTVINGEPIICTVHEVTPGERTNTYKLVFPEVHAGGSQIGAGTVVGGGMGHGFYDKDFTAPWGERIKRNVFPVAPEPEELVTADTLHDMMEAAIRYPAGNGFVDCLVHFSRMVTGDYLPGDVEEIIENDLQDCTPEYRAEYRITWAMLESKLQQISDEH